MNHATARILVVEDDIVTRTAIAGVLRERGGHEVLEAADGQQAWALLALGVRPDLCCIDYGLPHMRGLELMARMRADPVHAFIPVIVITGAVDREAVRAAMRQRAAGYLPKPVHHAELLSTVDGVLQRQARDRAEPLAATCERLAAAPVALSHRLGVLESRLAQALGEATGWERPQRQAQATLLGDECGALGLWHGEALLRSLREKPLTASGVMAVLGEAWFTVHARRCEAARTQLPAAAPAPASAPPTEMVEP